MASAATPQVFYGSQKCCASTKAGDPCKNKAYYLHQERCLCGVHCPKDSTGKRVELPKNPHAKEDKEILLEQRMAEVEAASRCNLKLKLEAIIILSKMRMMKEPEHFTGFYKIFPNYLHQNRADGFGCASLSPKSLGPVNHGQPGLPIALNLENFHQGNKVFPSEDSGGVPTAEFFATQKQMYLDHIPHRHKKTATELKDSGTAGVKGKNNVPLYSVWIQGDSKLLKLSYFESRQFYCTFYERLVTTPPSKGAASESQAFKDFTYLKRLKASGYNLQIIGYDAYPVNLSQAKDPAIAETENTEILLKCYQDISQPFGHELVLFTLLVLKDRKNYPWVRFTTVKF